MLVSRLNTRVIVEGRFTNTNLINFTANRASILDAGLQVDIIYADFQKAFDGVDHKILLHKLNNLGFSESLLALFTSYLKDKQQYVDYKGFKLNSFHLLI